MLRYYVKFAWRHLRKGLGYSFINIVGLAIGIASILLILLYVQHEFSFDDYHENREHIYLVTGYQISTPTNSKSLNINSVLDFVLWISDLEMVGPAGKGNVKC